MDFTETYFRRFRMEIDLLNARLVDDPLPEGYRWCPWELTTLDRHAITKYHSFRSELDARVFPCLGDIDGCRKLMRDISTQRNFLPGGTWLITWDGMGNEEPVDCGTIQAIVPSRIMGAIQNVGITPKHRGLGLGRALVTKCLLGFREAGVKRAYLEVTAENEPAINLYRSIGFRLTRTLYKPSHYVEAPSL
ncbi:GNAT family N-acetyltransferase [Gimesia chilikensis]|jgi:GNAT superfamily N-acetyltransferase|uniref:Ribosomal-protein-alanine N-acetyltransferase n=1 Tax=Gimesia chilikensis TaxID=2605989 RepID=A0A517WCR0_9PLAN|nr:N-acetyltransferase [Gimesia chilikensis]MCR9232547.1 GNAT family N-acetyltransferase [bacterium]QDT20934.1 ribosomal-protein-alanine N-acetyltransferase [Gimesia chilikensis]QDT84674.1 ribosomal-protein-alanine N-acetyltransferase [Gimesia chilikensis]QDU03038.1 ribosomal-protein-alanine N-acetyltransferase [Gimesia chilikensis]